jgi:hypothetical protein
MAGYRIQRLSFGEKLDQAFRLLRDHFVPLTAPFVVVYVPYNLAASALGLEEGAADLSQVMRKIGAFLVLLLFLAATAPLAQLVVNVVVADGYLGHPSSVRAALRRATGMYARYLGTTMLVGLALIGLACLLILPAIYFGIMWTLIGPVVVVEQVYGSQAMKRSRSLVKGHFWSTVGLMLVVGVLVGLPSAGLSVAFKAIPIIGPLLTAVVQAVGAGFGAAVLVVLYVDLRCRHEDFDLQLLARQIADSASLPPPAPQGTNAAAG